MKGAKFEISNLSTIQIQIGRVIWNLFWEISAKVKKLSDIKLPLAKFKDANSGNHPSLAI